MRYLRREKDMSYWWYEVKEESDGTFRLVETDEEALICNVTTEHESIEDLEEDLRAMLTAVENFKNEVSKEERND